MHQIPLSLFLTTTALGVLPGSARAPRAASEDLEERIGAAVAAAMEEDRIPGVSVAVHLGADSLLADGWGVADPDDDEPAGTDSGYRVGTMTEAFLVTAALRLAEEGKLDLEDEVHEHVKQVKLEGESITLHQLMTHTSGLPSYTDYALSRQGGDQDLAVGDVLTWLGGMPLDASPGTCFAYSNTNVLLLGLVVEDVTRQPAPVMLKKLVFDPSGMADTIYCADGPPLVEGAEIQHEFGGEIVVEGEIPVPFGAAGLCSTAPDLVRWMRGLVERDLVDEVSFRRMASDHPLADGTPTGRGYGFDLAELDGFAALTCGGGMAGARVHVAHYPGPDLTIAVLANADDARVDVLERRIARLVLDLPQPGLQDEPLTDEQRAKYLGSYYVGCSEYYVGEADGRLTVDPPLGPRWFMLFQGGDAFVCADDPDIRVEFHVDDDGPARSFLLDEHGITTVATRM